MVSIVIAAEDPSSWGIEDFGKVLGVVTALITILGGVVALWRLWRRHRHSEKLRDWLSHAEDLNRAFVGYQVHTSEQLAARESLTGDSQIEKPLTDLRAQVRGLRSDVVLERARDDIDRALSIICEASALYANGSWTWEGLGDAPRVNAEGWFTPVLALGPEDGSDTSKTTMRKQTVEALRRELELRVRTARHQLYPGRLYCWYHHRFRHQDTEQPDEFESHWAVFQRELYESKAHIEGHWSELEEGLTPPETSYASS